MARKKQVRRKSNRKKKNKGVSLSTISVLFIVFIVAIAIQQIVDGRGVGEFQEKVVWAIENGKDLSLDKLDELVKKKSTSNNNIAPDQLEIPAPLADRKERILRRKGYTVSYNDDLKIPNWVAWELTSEKTKGTFKRTDNFLPDPDLPERVRSLDSDYYRSRYDRGHMAPAGDMKWDEQAMIESFYFSNICPQAPNLNRGDWKILEEKCRSWAQSDGELYIVCGPVLKEGVNHKRIGKGKVVVPEGFFKVVLLMGNDPRAVGFLYPNDDCNNPLQYYAVTVDSVETVTGIDFYPALPDDLENRLEADNAINRFVKNKRK